MMTKKQKPADKPDTRDPRWVAFGKRLVDLRHARRLMAYDVAHLIEIDPATMSHIEQGKRRTGPERETIERLAKLYEMSVDELMDTSQKDRHATPPGREVFPRADADRDPRAASGVSGVQLADVRAAVYDAVFAAVTDIFEAVASARARTAQESGRETGGAVYGAPGEQRRSGTTGR